MTNSIGVNLQQVPRTSSARGCFGAQPGWVWIEADYSQIELRIAAFLARERHMLELYRDGADIHSTTAISMIGDAEYESRSKAKAVNFGFLYGMLAPKFVELAWNNYGLKVTEYEAQVFRERFFDTYPDLEPWHARQREFVRRNGYVTTPTGHVRHLPDINSPDRKVANEAERQAINSPVQSFASDIAVISLNRIGSKFRKLGLQTRIVGAVHDAILFEAPRREVRAVIPRIKRMMETPPLAEWFGVTLDVPLVADLSVGTHWGKKDTREVPPEIVFDRSALKGWVKEHVSC